MNQFSPSPTNIAPLGGYPEDAFPTEDGRPWSIGVLFGCFARKIDGDSWFHLFPLKGRLCHGACAIRQGGFWGTLPSACSSEMREPVWGGGDEVLCLKTNAVLRGACC